MIDRSISESRKFAGLASDTHRLMYLMILPHADREGRVEADPLRLRGVVFTRLNYPLEEIETGLDDLAEAGLIDLYRVDDIPYLQVTAFHEHNKPNQREADSKIASPTDPTAKSMRFTDKSVRPTDNAVKGPSELEVEVELEVESEIEEKKKHSSEISPQKPAGETLVAQARRVSVHPQDLLDAYNQYRGLLPAALTLNRKRKDQLTKLLKEHGDDALPLVIDATKCVANDDYWVEKGYNLDNLLRDGRVVEKAEKNHARRDKKLSAADMRLAKRAQAVYDAIGGGDLN